MRRADFDPQKVLGRSGYVTEPREGDRETRVKAAKRAYETESAEEILGRAPATHPAPFDCWAFIPKMLKKMQDPHLEIDLSQEELAQRNQFNRWYEKMSRECYALITVLDFFTSNDSTIEDIQMVRRLVEVADKVAGYYEPLIRNEEIEWLPKVMRSKSKDERDNLQVFFADLTVIQALRRKIDAARAAVAAW